MKFAPNTSDQKGANSISILLICISPNKYPTRARLHFKKSIYSGMCTLDVDHSVLELPESIIYLRFTSSMKHPDICIIINTFCQDILVGII